MALLKYTQARLAGDKLVMGVEAQPPVERRTVEDIARVMRLEVTFHTLEDGEGGSREIIIAADTHHGYKDESVSRLGRLGSRVGVESSRAEGRIDEVFEVEHDESLVAFVDDTCGSETYMGEISRQTEPGDRGLYLDPRLHTGSEGQELLNWDLEAAGIGHLAARTVWGWQPRSAA